MVNCSTTSVIAPFYAVVFALCCCSHASSISQNVSAQFKADHDSLPLPVNVTHRWRHWRRQRYHENIGDSFFNMSGRQRRKSRYKQRNNARRDVRNQRSSHFSAKNYISNFQESKMTVKQSDLLSNTLSSMPLQNERSGHNKNVVDFNSNSFFDPSIKITIEVLHEVDSKVATDKSEGLDIQGVSAEKMEELKTILSSIDSPLDGSQTIQGSGLFKPRNRHRPPKRKDKVKHRKRKHKYNDDSVTKGSWGSWSACSASCGKGIRERTRHCGPRCYQTERGRCFSSCSDHRVSNSKGLAGSSLVSLDDSLAAMESSLDGLDGSDPGADNCQKWIDCKNTFMISYVKRLNELPSCPCEYPLNLRMRVSDKVFDNVHQRNFRWLDASSEKERLDVYKKGARYCIRSRLDFSTGVLGSQQCCYDENMNLLTRGSGAGTPDLISPELSPDLHHRVDVLPWIVCKGDWTRFHEARKPNNDGKCPDNPNDEVLIQQQRQAKIY